MRRAFCFVNLVWLIIPIAPSPLQAAWVGPAAVTESITREASAGPCNLIPAGTILRVDSPERIKLSSLRAGEVLTGVLPHPLFLGECQVLPAETSLRLHVGKVTRVQDAGQGSRGWTSSLRNSLFPRRKHQVEFRSSEIVLADGAVVSIQPSLLDVRRASVVGPRNADRTLAGGPDKGIARKQRGSSLIISLESPVTLPPASSGVNPSIERLHAKEARVRLRLLQHLSATRNEMGQTFLARILEPLQFGDQVIVPEGSMIQGMIVQRKAPRRLRRAGQLRLAFGKVNLPDGGAIDLDASMTALEALRDSRMTIDKEGTVRAGAATKKRAALDLGLAYVVGKVVDDVLEESIKAGASAAAAGTITTAARYVGIAAGTVFFFAHRGRDVALPEYTELEIVVTRPEAAAKRPGSD